MSTRSETLAAGVEAATTEVIATVEGMSDADWRGTTAEGWPAGFGAWHIADGLTSVMGLVGMVANGGPLPPITSEMLDAQNASNLALHRDCSRDEVLSLLQANGATVTAAIRALSDEQLNRTATLPLMGPQPVSVAQLIEHGLTGHARGHLAAIGVTV